MQNLANSLSLEVTSNLVHRVKVFVKHQAFEKIQPVGWVKDGNFDMVSILSCVKNNYPFGYCPDSDKYLVDAIWDWSKLPRDLPISRLTFSFILGVETYSTCILQNVGRKKVKLADVWSHRPAQTGCWYSNLTSNIDLSKLSDAEIIDSIAVAQEIINTVCTLVFSDTPMQVEMHSRIRDGRKHEARRILSSLYMLDITTELPLSFNDRIQFMKLPKAYTFRTDERALEAYKKYFLSIVDRLDYQVVADLISDICNRNIDLMLGILEAINKDQISNMFLSFIHEQMERELDRLSDINRGKRPII